MQLLVPAPCQLQQTLKGLGRIGAPTVLMTLVTLLMMNLGPIAQNLDMTEYFAGEMAVPLMKQTPYLILFDVSLEY